MFNKRCILQRIQIEFYLYLSVYRAARALSGRASNMLQLLLPRCYSTGPPARAAAGREQPPEPPYHFRLEFFVLYHISSGTSQKPWFDQ